MAQLEQRLASSHSDAIAETRSAAGLVLQATGGRLPADSSTARAVLSNMPPSVRRNFVTDDYGAASVLVITRDLDTAQWKKLRSEITAEIASPPSGVKATLTGTPVLGMELLDALTGGRVRMTLIGVALVFSGLLLAFRFNLLRALIATLPIGLVLGWSSGFMFLLGIKYTPATATLGALILGIGTEFTILLMMRYYEERGNGMAPVEAMTIAMTKIGRAIIASGLTVIGGFAALLIARDFPILVDFGVVTMISVAFALLSTLLVLPPLIVWLDRTFIRARTPRPTAADEALARAVSEEERKVRV
jgi:predicted RND superfamily exporter protein